MPEPTGLLFDTLLVIMARLRGPGGCPWDREQTRDSLKPFLIEEAYEVLEALDSGQREALLEELGDLLFQVVFHARLAQELGEFSIADVLEHLVAKMTRRHPHVFGDRTVTSAQEALSQWEAIKHAEGKTRSVLDGVPRSLPALLRAQRLQAKAARVGFDWQSAESASAKVQEEAGELEAALARGDHDRVREEFGDLLFSLVNVARLLGIDAEGSLQTAAAKFRRRFELMEAEIAASGGSLSDTPLDELDRVWERVKTANDARPR
ncbi:MAG: nucleoside triphosphate pyrophosphohydrolase [Candidatus Rokubacteria bacterium]|nr:nucleoside triphosphate pyrophosphohydrolase [Candidatus Rokubacteria bacterium]